MIIQSTPVSFGALGTPILVGVNTGLGQGTNPEIAAFAARGGIRRVDRLPGVHRQLKVAILHAIAGTLMPLLILVSFMTRFFGRSRSLAEGLQVWPFAIFAALAMTVPYFAAAYFLGPEFPALMGSMAGLIIVVSAARKPASSSRSRTRPGISTRRRTGRRSGPARSR